MGKGQFNNHIKKKFGPGYLVLHHNPNTDKKNSEEHIKKVNSETSDQIASLYTMNPTYDLDFDVPIFGRILVKELKNKYTINDVVSFFKEFKEATNIVITVKSLAYDVIDEKSHVILEFKDGHIRMLHARFLWAILPPSIKNIYIKSYNDPFNRLSNLFDDLGKKVESETYD